MYRGTEKNPKPTLRHNASSQSRLLHAALDALPPGRILNRESTLLQHRLERVDDLVKAACRASLLCESCDGDVALPTMLQNCEKVSVKVDRLEVEVW